MKLLFVFGLINGLDLIAWFVGCVGDLLLRFCGFCLSFSLCLSCCLG